MQTTLPRFSISINKLPSTLLSWYTTLKVPRLLTISGSFHYSSRPTSNISRTQCILKMSSIDMEKQAATSDRLERLRTDGGHVASTEQPSLPIVHRRLANPAPLGLLSFATGIFLISILGVNARGVTTPNVLVGVLMFFGGVCQFISGIMEFVAGNTFGATVFPSYAAFNFSYAMIYIPGTGIIACECSHIPSTTISH